LLIHGDQDGDVPFQESVLMSKELKRCDIDHEFVAVPNHGRFLGIDGEGMKDPAVSETFDQVLVFLEKQGMQEKNGAGVTH
jgi:hypothetical protein